MPNSAAIFLTVFGDWFCPLSMRLTVGNVTLIRRANSVRVQPRFRRSLSIFSESNTVLICNAYYRKKNNQASEKVLTCVFRKRKIRI